MFKNLFWTIGFVYKIDRINFIKRIFFQSFLSIENLFGFFIVGLIIQSIVNDTDLTQVLVLTVVINFILFTFRILHDYSSRIIEAKYPIAMNRVIFTKLNQNSVQDNEDPIVQNMVNLVEEVKESPRYFFENLLLLTANLFALMVSGITIFVYTPIIIPLTILVLLPKTFLNRKFLTDLHKINRDGTVERRRAYGVVRYITDANAYKESWILGTFSFFEGIFNNFSNNYISKIVKLRRSWVFWLWFGRIFDLALYIFGIILLADLFQNGDFQIATVSLALASMITFRGNAESLNFSIVNLIEQSNKVQEIKKFLDYGMTKPAKEEEGITLPSSKGDLKLQSTLEAELQTKADTKLLLRPNNTLPIEEKTKLQTKKISISKFESMKFENLKFKYNNSERIVIDIPELIINRGEKIAIVGHNGAGKSTLIKIMTGIYQPTIGSFCVNGIDINSIDENSWRSQLGVLFQDFTTYEHLTLRENLLLGYNRTDLPTEEQILEAINLADAEFVQNYPKGLDTMLSEKYDKGIRPSGGQWQKISIARYFLRETNMLILDEPTSSIDAISEYNIFNNIYVSTNEKTVVIISHRFSTVRKADRIIVLDQGNIAEEGSHAELLKLDGIYAKSFEKQKLGYE